MRATVTPAPTRRGKRHLLESCAIAAGMAALALGGPALAQVSGTGSFVTGGGGSSITNNAGTNTTTVNLGANQSIINWVPTDTSTATTNPIDFLATGENLNFNGAGNYIVLNRFVDGSGGSLSRQIALNGTINSTNSAASGARGGSIWFYNAGGILIGATGIINVGSLVLTSNDIVTTGGLLDPTTGAIRFRGVAGSTSAITVNGAINANEAINAGSAYVALVAPRVVQAGTVRVDGSAAYVAAEQADIRINGGLFDINVLVGAEGGNVITHTGNTTGPAHQQGDTDQSRIYMVAIPKNDAVTMLVSGAIGYDDALSAQVDPDGAVRLSAGYNITAGELNAAPVNATAANITAGDTLFRSNTVARASGAFAGQPTQQLPAIPPPLSSTGQFFVEGSGTFTGDASATLAIGVGQRGGATGSLTVQSGGVNGAAGNAAVNVTGGTLSAANGLTILASGQVQSLTGDSQGGTASLTITGGSVTAPAVQVEANGIADIGTNGAGGDGRGGTASITVSNAGSTLTAANIFINSVGRGDGTFIDGSGTFGVVDAGGDGQGGMSTLTVSNGGAVGPAALLSLDARGFGATGLVQSGGGAGGTARIQLSGAGSFLSTMQTFLQAGGDGGASFSSPFGTFLTPNGGDAAGGTAELLINADATATASLGAIGVNALARGGNAGGSENASGGDALGGTATLTADGGVNAQFTAITLNASAQAGTAGSPSGASGRSGNAQANNVTLAATNGSTINSSNINLFAVGMGIGGENFGTGQGGNIAVNATSGGTISASNQVAMQAMGGSTSSAIGQSAGNGTGGNIDLSADGGTIRADVYAIDASASTVNVTGAGGAAQGGTIDLTASNGGQILALVDAISQFDASATTGVSADGSAATGGGIRFIANGGTIGFSAGATLVAGGTSGGATAPGAGGPVGTGGSILIQAVADALDSSAINLGDFDASADGRTAVDFESDPGLPRESAGSGQGGTTSFDIQGGTLTASSINVSANGFGGNAAGGSTGFGGTATFTQTGGDANVGDMTISADGFGGVASGQSGSGIGGTATIDLLGGTITGADIIATADGRGGQGSEGNDDDPANIFPGGLGGTGQGGTATINIDGSTVVNASIIVANAAGIGGAGGDFFNASSFGSSPGPTGNGGNGTGGNATVDVRGGTTTASSMIADASGIGGTGGNSFFSSSSGGATGVGVGGTGGTGQGGTATIALQTAIDAVGNVDSIARGVGGNGGNHNVGGSGGDGFGGLAQAIVTNFEAGELAVTLDSGGQGGNGSDGRDGAGGNGGNGAGGTARMLADGPGASLTVIETNFINDGTGGNGGAGGLGFGSFVPVAPSGGNGGNGQGGTIEVAANEGATVSLGIVAGDSVVLGSIGTGGNGGAGSDSNFDENARAGDGGNGGGGNGGTVRLVTGGGTITSNGESVTIDAGGTSGASGIGGTGQGGGANGANGGFSGTAGGRVVIEALNGLSSPGQIALGLTDITANGDTAGRIELRAEGNLSFAGLDAEALGFANPTNNDTNDAPAGIFLAMNGGTIVSQGDASLTTDSSVGVYAQSNGIFDVDGILTINSGDQIDIRHEFREGTAPTIRASDSLIATALNSISGAPGSLLGAGDTLSLTATGVTGTIGVDRLGGTDIVIGSNGAASVEHAEAANDFTATAGSFRTGPNSIITGGDIVITSPGAIDLGNSTAGGFVQVQGQSIAFNSITAGLTVGLSADGTAAGAEGINGGSIAAGEDINLFANSIALTGTVTGNASFFAFGTGGPVSVNDADVDGTISIFSAADLTGTYVAGGDIFLNSDANISASAQANGGYIDRNGNPTQGNLFVIAGTTANLTDITGGDDINVRAVGNINALNVRTTGAGADTHILDFSAASGSPTFTIGTGEGSQGINGADIVMASTAGAIDAAALSAGDDILLNAANNLVLNGATTLGLGTTGGDSSIRTQGGATTLAGLNSFSDVVVDAAGLTNLTGVVAAGRNATINAQDVTLAVLTDTGGTAISTLSADGDVVVNSAASITGGGVRALGNATLTAANAIGITSIEGQDVTLTGAAGITADAAYVLGTTNLDSSGGNIQLGSLVASGLINASANAIRIEGGGNMHFAALTTDVGDAYVRGGGDFSVANGNVTGTADLRTQGEAMNIGNLTAANAIIENAGGFLNLDTVTVAGSLNASARSSLGINGVVAGQAISLSSADISIAPTGRVGTAGVTQSLSVANNNTANQTFVGGTAGPNGLNGYHIDTDELTRLYGTQIEIFAPEVQAAGSLSVGSAAPPDVIVDSFTMTGGAAGSNLGANGALTIRTPGKMRVIGNVQLTGLTDANALNLIAGEALEVILGQGSVRLVNGANPAGQLNMASDDIIVATMDAIADVGAATRTDAINARLGENDGVALDEGALFARGIRADVVGGFYVQNSGAGTDFGQRRGLTFGAGGLDVLTEGTSRIVVNGVQLGANGQVTGLDAIPLLTVAGAAPAPGSFDPRSTFNGCFIANPTACTTVTVNFENRFPVQDVIEEEADAEGDDGDGNSLPTPLITMRDLDPLSGEPLLDDPVTGAGNDDLWTTPGE